MPYNITYMWNLKNMVQMNLLTKQKESQMRKTNLQLPRGKQAEEGKDTLGDWD